MSYRLLGTADYTDMPWKNGGGTTCELFRLPHPARPADFALRLSIATVAQGGPFSAFPGVDRTLLLLEGAGMALRFDGSAPVRLEQTLQPIVFAGETPVDCTLLDGPLRDFNLMVARDWGRAALQIQQLTVGASLTLADGAQHLVYLHTGEFGLGGQTINAGQLVHTSGTALTLHAQAAATLIIIEVHPAAAL
ncbi:HutD family protein [Chitinimonas sp. BJYL2]|uniref:HutD/Ves family protein n=1 Tax=Chitinimonas sp. BJYL2 TaxID=2976696 RepID=UPI0022B47545|nr:HutD family protein [Chitinimonas sp. BJYL2]